MNVCVVGTGYVGLVTGVVFASLGNDVVCVDKDEQKIANLKQGIMPIYEPGLEEYVERNVAEERLVFTTDLPDAVGRSEVVFIAVGTPPMEDGSTDLRMVGNVARDIATSLKHYTLIVNKSTVPVGTGNYVRQIVEQNRTSDIPFEVVSNPEFLREGSAIKDTLEPDRIVIGANTKNASMKLLELYAPLERTMIITDVESAELIKYASNAFLAVKITFANAMANICDATGANIADVTKGMGMDSRIGSAFLNAGIGFGGSCFPKDTRSLIATASELGYDFELLKATVKTNDEQPMRFVGKMRAVLGGLKGKKIGVLGLAFKGNTDDLRDSKAVEVVQALLAAGAAVTAFDPVAMDNARRILPDIDYAKNAYDVAIDADALAVVTEWNEFKQINLARLATILRGKVVFDGKNLYNPEQVRQHGLKYYGVGRGDRVNGCNPVDI